MEGLTKVKSKIYEIRGQKVMLDRDLAELYGIETRVLNQAVKRNKERFPEDFLFQLTDIEWSNLKSQIVTSSWGGVRRPPYAFTEHGVAMLSSVLSSRTAIQVNIAIMRTFVAVRQAVAYIPETQQRLSRLEQDFSELKADLEDIFSDYNDINEDTRMQLELINKSLAELQAERKGKNLVRPKIGFTHQ